MRPIMMVPKVDLHPISTSPLPPQILPSSHAPLFLLNHSTLPPPEPLKETPLLLAHLPLPPHVLLTRDIYLLLLHDALIQALMERG